MLGSSVQCMDYLLYLHGRRICHGRPSSARDDTCTSSVVGAAHVHNTSVTHAPAYRLAETVARKGKSKRSGESSEARGSFQKAGSICGEIKAATGAQGGRTASKVCQAASEGPCSEGTSLAVLA